VPLETSRLARHSCLTQPALLWFCFGLMSLDANEETIVKEADANGADNEYCPRSARTGRWRQAGYST
jgi:hypothetical protein